VGIGKRSAHAVSEPKPRGDEPGAVGVSTTAGRDMVAAVDAVPFLHVGDVPRL